MGVDEIAAMVVAAGAVGTAAMGVVDSLKTTWYARLFGLWIGGLWRGGFEALMRAIEPLHPALAQVYGSDAVTLPGGAVEPRWRFVLALHYRGDHTAAAMKDVISRSVRLGLAEIEPSQLQALGHRYGQLDGAVLTAAMQRLKAGEPLEPTQHALLERLMGAIEAHLEGAAMTAAAEYASQKRVYATFIAIGLGFVAAFAFFAQDNNGNVLTDVLRALLIGVIAVPAAPIAKDLATAIRGFARPASR